MLRSNELFESDILTQAQFYKYMEEFSEQSCYFYRAFDYEDQDRIPNVPLFVDHSDSHNLAFIMGLVGADTPGRVILQGVAKVAGYKPIVMTAYEHCPGIPASLPPHVRLSVLNKLRKRLRHSIAILAERAGLEAFNQYDVEEV